MRTPRIVILVAFSVAFFTLLFLSARTPSQPSTPIAEATTNTYTPPTTNPKPNTGLFTTFSFSAPLSLFPPNAIISLTDDNTTAFHARPAAFGPALPKNGMSGQLWIGSGFGDERLGNAGAELGCSDLPGWSDGHSGHKEAHDVPLQAEGKKAKEEKKKHSKRVQPAEDAVSGLGAGIGGVADGTDDYLHPVAPGVDIAGAVGKIRILDKPAVNTHADIQSLQESAEISGKVVLLQRGGCGFLEKVLWAQRRGGIAVIVGDDIPNRPLIQMYARGDTSNVTVPSVFTSRNTARMLSSLYGEGVDNGEPKKPKKKEKEKKPSAPSSVQPVERGTWLGRLLSGGNTDSVGSVDVDVLDQSDQIGGPAPAKLVKNLPASKSPKPKSGATADDGFVIGVQDWRDPDVVNVKAAEVVRPDTSAKKSPQPQPKKGPIVPEKAVPVVADFDPKKVPNLKNIKPVVVNPPNAAAAVPAHADATKKPSPAAGKKEDEPGLLTKIFGDDRDLSDSATGDGTDEDDDDDTPPSNPPHEGVWVTLTQTNGATPFFDTLLVLVVSPLVTLTVVYAMLLIRSRIRRRRWRAPKSVVQQLPVRTFIARDTRNDSNASQGSGGPGRSHSPLPGGEATPLLGGRPRPRSRTTSGLPEPGLSRTNSATGLLDEPKPLEAQRKGSNSAGKGGAKAAAGSQWKKYMGRQVECVVCLEEYIDGVSRVMSLPCGHEFHVECITPWLTTRRRTCPICKGDVVRSLQRANISGSTSPRYIPYQEDGTADSNDEQDRVATRRNESPSADRPISPHGDEDVEQGVREQSPRTSRERRRRGEGSGSWFQNLAERVGLVGPVAEATEDRRRD